MMLAELQTESHSVAPSAQSQLAQSMIATMGRESAISACWANEWFGVLEEIYALDREAVEVPGPQSGGE